MPRLSILYCMRYLKKAGKPIPTIAYVGAASADNKAFFLMMAALAKGAGAGKIKHVILSSTKADIKKAKDILESSDIVYISGGDVEQGMQILQEKNITDFLVGLYKQGKPFFGISAGSIMLAKEWIRWRDPEDDTTAEIFPCLGIAPVICDTHGEQDGWEELQALLKLWKKIRLSDTALFPAPRLKSFPTEKLKQWAARFISMQKSKEKWKGWPIFYPAVRNLTITTNEIFPLS